MATLGDYLTFNDSSLIIWRDGSASDPYVNKSDTLKIVNNRSVLDEIPDPQSKVKIYDITGYPSNTDWTNFDLNTLPSMIEIDTTIYNAPKTPSLNQYIVNYSNGIITFNSEINAQNRLAIYKSRGKILIPASRIWLQHQNPYAVDNLQEFVDLATLKIIEIETAISNAEIATTNANNAAILANSKAQYAQEQGNRVEILILNANTVLSDAITATTNANNATVEALSARDLCIDARNRSILVWQSSVESYGLIASVYPAPEIGWTVLTEDTGTVYRYDGSVWRDIGTLTMAIPLATESLDGLMSATSFIKLKEIENKAQVNFIGEDAKNVLPDYFKTKTIVFLVPTSIFTGTQGLIIKFPYNGQIVDVSASCDIQGTDSTEISIEKVSQNDFINKGEWINILSTNLFIDYGERIDDGRVVILDNIVNENDYFRINVIRAGTGIENLLVEIKIKI